MSTTYRELRSAIDALNVAEKAFIWARQAEADAHARVGRALRACRERHKISLRAAAKKLKVSAPYLSDVERGFRNLSTDHLECYMGIVMPITQTEELIETIQAAQKCAHKTNLLIGPRNPNHPDYQPRGCPSPKSVSPSVPAVAGGGEDGARLDWLGSNLDAIYWDEGKGLWYNSCGDYDSVGHYQSFRNAIDAAQGKRGPR